MSMIPLGLSVVLGAVALLALGRLFAAWRRTRGTRILICPETHTEEAVEISVGTAIRNALRGNADLSLGQCTRWPERQDCGQDCLSQIEGSPNGCSVVGLLHNWYANKHCALCEVKIGDINWHTHRPGLMSSEHKMISLDTLPAKKLHSVLASSLPVCWDCLVVETFIEKNPEKVTYRPGTVVRHGGVNHPA